MTRILLCSLLSLWLGAVGCSKPIDSTELRRRYDSELAPQLAPLLCEVIRFPTYAGNVAARDEQHAWLLTMATRLGLVARDKGKVVEIELPGPDGAPVLGLVVHGDVQAVDAASWSIPPFAGVVKDGEVLGRGSCDDKGPLVQALLAMKAMADHVPQRTHTIRLLVGSDEESENTDIAEYLAANEAPDYSLVLDYIFPVVVGEKAWNGLYLSTTPGSGGRRNALPYEVASLTAGLAPSIVPDMARLELRWRRGTPAWQALAERLAARPVAEGTRLESAIEANRLVLSMHGKSAHGGVNLEGGRNALVALAKVMQGELPPCGESDLLEFARLAGADLHGTGLGLTREDPIWGRYAVNVATIAPKEDGEQLELVIVLRRTPPMSGAELRAHLAQVVSEFNERTGAKLVPGEQYYEDDPIAFDPQGKLVQRLLAAYTRATGTVEKPAIAGGGTYAKRLPNSIAFGMWFPGVPYPGHDVDEKISLDILQRGTHVLLEALHDLACGPPIERPFEP